MPELRTLIAISCLAYVSAVALHEHAGHAAACVLLGSHPLELGAFYVNCDDSRLGPSSIRAVALAGPVVSLLTGLASFAVLSRLRSDFTAGRYFTWLLGSIGVMEAAGYLLFSGVSGLGDLGTGADGVLFGASPAWAWRAGLALCGILGYIWAVKASLKRIEVSRAVRRSALVSYVTGAAIYLAIGALNPYGLQIVLLSALPASLGGTSGLVWMFNYAGPAPSHSGAALYFGYRWSWILVASLVTLGYAWAFGPSR